jgi:hypothetical protein
MDYHPSHAKSFLFERGVGVGDDANLVRRQWMFAFSFLRCSERVSFGGRSSVTKDM